MTDLEPDTRLADLEPSRGVGHPDLDGHGEFYEYDFISLFLSFRSVRSRT